MTAAASLVDMHIQTPVDGVFVLNRSRLDGPDVLATGDADGYQWTPALCDATSVRVRRGGRRDGVSTAIEVGTLTAAFRTDTTDEPTDVETRRNLIPNPSSEQAVAFASNLNICTAARSTATADRGTYSTMLTATASGTVAASTPIGTNGVPVERRVPYVARFAARRSAASGARSVQARVDWYTATGATAGLSTTVTVFTAGFTFQVAAITVTPPAAAAFGAVRVLIPGAVAGEVFYVDSALFEDASTYDGTYFDGDTPPTQLDRDTRLVRSWVGTPHASASVERRVYGPFIPDPTRNLDARPGVGVRLVARDSGLPLFTGTTGDLDVADDKLTDVATVHLSGVDSVQPLANTMRYGAANPMQEWEGWERRAERLLVSSPVPFVSPPRPENTPLAGWTGNAGTWASVWAEANQWGALSVTSPNAADPPFTIVMNDPTLHAPVNPARGTRSVSGFVPGRPYRATFVVPHVDGALQYGVIDANVQITDTPPPTIGWQYGTFSVDFVATAPSHTLVVRPWAPSTSAATARLSSWRIEPLTTVHCANVVYESNLANHLDLVANTAQVGWFVDRYGHVRFTSPLDPSPTAVAHLSDDHDPADPLHVCYTAADITYDTRALVTDLSLSNHARQWDDQSGWVADDRNLGPYGDEVAGATWGRRSASVETCVADVPGTVWQDSARALARDILADYSTPRVVVRRVMFDGLAHPQIAADLEVYDRVTVRRRAVHQTSRVVGIEHDLGPARWNVTLDLMEDF